MRRSLTDYRDLVGESKISDIYRKGRKISTKHILHVNATYYGGGVAEILKSTVPLLNDVGIDMGWRSMLGSRDFFGVTKKFHNALQGEETDLTEMKKRVYEETVKNFASFTHVPHDLVVVHDYQPLPLVKFYKRKQPWIWRCHLDLSDPNKGVWRYLKSFALPYDLTVYQMKEFAAKGFSEDYEIIRPAIDPLTTKNKDIDKETVYRYLDKIGVDPARPIISQISRFDKWKDPSGVIEVYKRIREEMDCQLVMMGSMATDDPEGQEVYDRIRKESDTVEDITLIVDAPDIMVNALQRASDVVLQKSIKEGFGMTVSEALWKETPVIASDVGGLPTQVIDGENGYLVNPTDYGETAGKVMDLLSDGGLREKMGEKGRQHVRENFLITRLIEDWIDLWRKVLDD